MRERLQEYVQLIWISVGALATFGIVYLATLIFPLPAWLPGLRVVVLALLVFALIAFDRLFGKRSAPSGLVPPTRRRAKS